MMGRCKKLVFGLCCGILMLTGTIATSAYSTTGFSCTATKLMDGETMHVKKQENKTKAIATVYSMTEKGKSYEMWVEKGSNGANVTFSYAFTTPKTIKMPYKRPVYQTESYKAKLNIGTSLNTFSSCDFTGVWSPNLSAND